MSIYKIAIAVLLFVSVVPYSANAAMCDYDGDGSTDANWSVVNGVCVPAPAAVGGLSNSSVTSIATNAMSWIIGFAGLMAILGFLISAFLYFTAAGDEDKAKLGKQAFWYTTIGVTVALGAYVVITVINTFLSAGAL